LSNPIQTSIMQKTPHIKMSIMFDEDLHSLLNQQRDLYLILYSFAG
jgi:hypothetical protein